MVVQRSEILATYSFEGTELAVPTPGCSRQVRDGSTQEVSSYQEVCIICQQQWQKSFE